MDATSTSTLNPEDQSCHLSSQADPKHGENSCIDKGAALATAAAGASNDPNCCPGRTRTLASATSTTAGAAGAVTPGPSTSIQTICAGPLLSLAGSAAPAAPQQPASGPSLEPPAPSLLCRCNARDRHTIAKLAASLDEDELVPLPSTADNHQPSPAGCCGAGVDLQEGRVQPDIPPMPELPRSHGMSAHLDDHVGARGAAGVTTSASNITFLPMFLPMAPPHAHMYGYGNSSAEALPPGVAEVTSMITNRNEGAGRLPAAASTGGVSVPAAPVTPPLPAVEHERYPQIAPRPVPTPCMSPFEDLQLCRGFNLAGAFPNLPSMSVSGCTIPMQGEAPCLPVSTPACTGSGTQASCTKQLPGWLAGRGWPAQEVPAPGSGGSSRSGSRRYNRTMSWGLAGHAAQHGYQDIAPDELKCRSRIGGGSFGDVIRGVWGDADVAIKYFRDMDVGAARVQQFKAEVTIMSRLRHPNIVLLMGAVTRGGQLAIVTEFVPRGSLFRLLHSEEGARLDGARRLGMARDIARGMEYLHGLRPPVVHRDLKTQNLLVDNDLRVKVCDFGLSKYLEGSYMSTGTYPGTVGWMAPEVMDCERSRKQVDEKCDVYSFGVIMYELVTGRRPWEGLNSMQVMFAIGHNKRLELPAGVEPRVEQLIERCWATNPGDRPSFTEILEAMSSWEELRLVPSSARQSEAGAAALQVLP
ncbi:hypothetical protein Agub_g1277 [Astrephomene gubernaculifera]|uniref:Protein kinase domain-containing protein n=1 Tax=Astrephomene gubernaculifera TaxID=47775 RepID=A0AAD3HHE3_9CHLO|nr:hypothetical protein Agub_g1277 [Astrephomene gubernaculifera]